MVPDAKVFSSIKNEPKYPWLYDSGTPRLFIIIITLYLSFKYSITADDKYKIKT
jgi:hypothetical protein